MMPAADGRLVPLADLVAAGPEDQEPAPGFRANLHGEDVEVTAVLQRTAVVASLRDRWADKQLVPLGDLVVDPAVIMWRPKALSGRFKRRLAYSPEQREALRAATDRRARADQARRTAAEATARETAPLQHGARPRRADTTASSSRPPAMATSQRPITESAASASPRPAASKAPQPAHALASELRRAQQRIADLEAELQRHRAVALDVVRRVEVVVARRAACRDTVRGSIG